MKVQSSDATIIADKIISYLKSKGKLELIPEVAKNLLANADTKKVNVYHAVTLSGNQKKKII